MDILTSVLSVYMTLFVLVTLSTLASPEECNENPVTVYIEDGAAFVELSCGEVPQSAVAIEWIIKKSAEWTKVLKFYHTEPGHSQNIFNTTKYDISESANTSLLVINIKPSDSALFKCISNGGSTHERCVMLQVVDQPEVSIDNPTAPVVEYTTRNLTCRINGGNPSDPVSYHYKWMYRPTYRVSDTDIPLPNGSSVIDGGKTLQLTDLSYEDMAGTYKCTVTVAGHNVRSTGNSTLDVYYAAKLESTLEELTVYAALHSSADLTVKFHINPVNNYKVSWSRGDTEVQDSVINNAVKGKHVETTYSILDVTESQLGNYTVQVTNQAIKREPDKAMLTVVLELRGSPEKPINITVLSKTYNSITVGWTAGVNGGSEQKFKVLYREKGQDKWEEYQDSISGLKAGETINYTINGLNAVKEYEITVVVINQFPGWSESDAEVQTVLTESVPVGKSSSVTVAVCLVVVCLVIAAVITVVVYMLRKRKLRLQDQSKARVTLESEYQAVPTVSHLDQVGAANIPQHSVVNDSPVAGDIPIYAQPNKTAKKKQNGTQAKGRKGKSRTGKGKKSRPKPTGHPVSPPSDSDYETGQSRENIVLQKMPIAEDEEQVVYMNTSDPQKQNNPAPIDGPTLVYADFNFQHIDPARQEAVPNTEDKSTYASVDFDLTKEYTLYENLSRENKG